MEEKMQGQEADPKKEYNQFEVQAGKELEENAEKIEKLKEGSPVNNEDGPNQRFFFYYRNLSALEQKNNDLKDQLQTNKFDSNWREFIGSFKRYMNDLMVAFKNFAR